MTAKCCARTKQGKLCKNNAAINGYCSTHFNNLFMKEDAAFVEYWKKRRETYSRW